MVREIPVVKDEPMSDQTVHVDISGAPSVDPTLTSDPSPSVDPTLPTVPKHVMGEAPSAETTTPTAEEPPMADTPKTPTNLSDSNPSERAPPQARYYTCVREFMAYTHQKSSPYPKDHVFPQDEFRAITPSDITKWMCKKVFGREHPGPNDKPVLGRSSSLEFYKKAISFFMEHPKKAWDPINKNGNPAKSKDVKNLINDVKRREGTPIKESRATIRANEAAMEMNFFSQQPQPPVAAPERAVRSLLLRMHAQNVQFINFFQNVNSSLENLTSSIEQMKAMMLTHNIAIMGEVANINQNGIMPAYTAGDNSAAAGDGSKEDISAVSVPLIQPLPPVDVSDLINNSAFNKGEGYSVKSEADGYCSFDHQANGRCLDVPRDFDLPSCSLFDAWRHWLIGFPDHKIKTNEDEIIDAPIKPLRHVPLRALPVSLKKRVKDGWRPIMYALAQHVEDMVENTPVQEINHQFIVDSYSVAVDELKKILPGLFDDREKCKTWKVATWSRKIREEQKKIKEGQDAYVTPPLGDGMEGDGGGSDEEDKEMNIV